MRSLLSLEEQLERSESQGGDFVFGLEIESGEHSRAPVDHVEDFSSDCDCDSVSDDDFESEEL